MPDEGPSSGRRPLVEAATLSLLVALLLGLPSGPLGPLDNVSADWLRRSLVSAGSVYATVRALNGTVSVLKESDVELEPAGVGVSIAAGQILDPLDDMTERLSDVVVMAIVALGVHAALHEVAAATAAPILAFALALLAGLSLVRGPRWRPLRRSLRLLCLLVVALRLASPLSAISGQWLHEQFFSSRIAEATRAVQAGLVELDDLTELDPREGGSGFLDAVRSAGQALATRVDALRRAFAQIRSQLDELIEALLTLTGLYAATALLQGVLLPIATLLAVVLFGRAVLRAALYPTRSEREV